MTYRGTVRVDGAGKKAIDYARARLLVTGLAFFTCFVIFAGRIVALGVTGVAGDGLVLEHMPASADKLRADILDRNGIVLATNLVTASLYANPRKVLDPVDAAAKLSTVFPNLNRTAVEAKLSGSKAFVWLKRKLTPAQQDAANRLGIPGLAFRDEVKRVYPQGPLLAHVLGHTDLDNRGRAGIEAYLDKRLAGGAKTLAGARGPLTLSIDARVQHVLRDELSNAMKMFKAKGAAGLIMDVRSGELVAMTSLPDFDPNSPAAAIKDERFVNRVTYGVYEMGSTFKTFTVAMALENGTVRLNDGYDATQPIRIARHTIHDDHAKARWLSVPEIYMYSSNIATAKMALDAGPELQRSFLERLGMFSRPSIELLEVGTPQIPKIWRDINTVTVAYGHGIAVSGLQLASAISAVSNGGLFHPATLVKRDPSSPVASERVVTAETSAKIQALMRLVVERGTGRRADAKGYLVGGKTGTAEKIVDGRYVKDALLSSFIGVFPSHDPRFVIFAMLDEPQGTEETFGFASGGWTAAPVVRRTVIRAAPMLGVKPVKMETHPLTDELLTLLRPEVRS